MIYTIRNSELEVDISTVGAELMSVRHNGCEYLWQGNPEFWSSRASNLFPICGRLTDGKYTYRGKEYEMRLHGYARKTEMEPVSVSEDSVSFRLVDDDVSFAQYPFHYELTIGYKLSGTTIKQTFTVKNTGDETLPFAVGGHPGFNVPLEKGESFEDYYVEFDDVSDAKQAVMSAACYDTGKREPFALENGKKIRLRHDLFDNDAIFLTNISKGITLKSDKGSRSVHLSYPGMNNVGLWHKPCCEAPYVCIEPWYSLPAYDGKVDDLETKQLMVRLEKGKTYENTMEITVK